MAKEEIFSAVVFDMDGVVIDTRKPIEAFWYELADKHRITITTEIMERQIHGCPARQTVYALFSHLPAQMKEEIFEQCEHFETHMDYLAMSGIKDFFRSLKKYAVPVALVTSSLPPKVAKVIKHLELNGIFDTIVTSDMVEKGKPDPACYRLAAKQLNNQPENCMVFEDAVSGVKAANGAGMFTVGVGGTYQTPMLREAGAGEVITNFEQVRLMPSQEGLILQISSAMSVRIAGV